MKIHVTHFLANQRGIMTRGGKKNAVFLPGDTNRSTTFTFNLNIPDQFSKNNTGV